ncbi:DUF2752 domain-containing protein [Edaphobacter sp. 12200R-103]|uniref:DUF2752 domain-containing protein n=1 Tax=Edaphobacter sp. 12200R-103 TaxID=2703788 RepID=UPI00138C6309|nr:DUF2752 domain-containing protein [Edaphobacter sp. 12200R-103]QHS52997.1 DUF2752 domain-containing protein [Edaphobacter sp. 12200R-103]
MSVSLPISRGSLSSRTVSTAAGTERISVLLLLVAAATVLLLFPPARYSFYPQCPVHRYLGILCPGCGTTRALAALLHGHFGEALRLNPLATVGIPFALLWRLFSRKPLRLLQPSPVAIRLIFAAVAAFTLARNL